ncbi:MAG: DUF4340 domain-containing protein, partial [Bacteroidetes bacterium]|nr:DUF4340 domain-containing protein [Bacteroidota bacterium]
ITNNNGTFNKELKDFAIEDSSVITRVFLTDKTGRKVDVVKIAPGNWSLNKNYHARNEVVEVLLKTLLNIEVKQPVPKAAHNNVVKNLASTGVKVEVYASSYRINLFGKIKLFPYEKCIKTFYVGGATQDNMGTYMLMENSSVPFITHIPGFRGYLSTRFSSVEDDWRDPTIFDQKLDEIKSVTLKNNSEPNQSFTIVNNQNRTFNLVSLIDGKTLTNYDTSKVIEYMASFGDIKFEALLSELNKNKKDSIIKSKPFHILSLTDSKGKVHTMKTFHKRSNPGEADELDRPVFFDRDRLYALINDDKDFVLIQFYVCDKILRPLNYFSNNSLTSKNIK